MSPAQVFRFALAGLAANKLRSALTTLGILIGVGSVILLVAVGNGSSQSVQNAISSLGANAITVLHTEGSAGPAAAPTSSSTAFAEPQDLTTADAQALAQAQGVASASPAVSTSETLSYGASSDSASLTGTYPSYFPAEDDTLSAGSYFTTQEVNTAQDVVVLGAEAASDLFGTADPVGKSVLVAGVPFTVVGVLATKGASGLSSADNTAVAPLTTVQDALTGFGTLNDVVVVAKSAALVDTVEGEITSILDRRHHETAADADFEVLSASTLLSTASSTAHTFTVLLGAVAAISLAGRRHRHHEHHAGHSDRTDPRDRYPQGHRRHTGRDPGAVPDRGDPAVDDRRGARRPGRCHRHPVHDRRGQARHRAVVDPAGVRGQRADRPVLRRLPGQPRSPHAPR